MKKNIVIGLVVLVALAGGLWVQVLRQAPVSTPPGIGAASLDFAFPDVDGQMQNIRQWQGKILVINFWATWCGPCLQEIPEFIRLQDEYGGRGVQFVGIAIEDREAVAAYLKGVAVNYPVMVAGDAGSYLARQLGNIINAVPFTVIVDHQGQIVHRQPGELSRQQFQRIVEPLLTAPLLAAK
ncbi:MAG: TlpA family protein disulfide reductase [Methylomonas sp.]|nr:TlpA family protein disulfide reductase [Methylomonas sp.]PPD20875.1 MAG: redoxin [Methylomonas sp.]PPD26336.1 MAG: redoxin [Methylomonas sp.]PPD38057.1 MAG: redoxin [Methylomonas sp.]PPD40307.1 MAG: redoxin [Methylomonas sp.]